LPDATHPRISQVLFINIAVPKPTPALKVLKIFVLPVPSLRLRWFKIIPHKKTALSPGMWKSEKNTLRKTPWKSFNHELNAQVWIDGKENLQESNAIPEYGIQNRKI